MNKLRGAMVKAAFLSILVLCAGFAVTGCSSMNGGMATNVTSGTPLPVYHQKPGDMTPKQARNYWMARRTGP